MLQPLESELHVSNEYVVVGGAGFIGSHFVERLISEGKTVTVVDNFCSGSLQHLEPVLNNPNFNIIEQDVENTALLIQSFKDARVVIHLASNPDIAKAAVEPRIDFTQGTVLTESVAEAARVSGVRKILYASGSGVYGDAGETILTETSPLHPISTYGASKLAGEALLASYTYMFEMEAMAFRFANVVGGKQTHGVGFDFLRRLMKDPGQLTILGNGLQDKSYVHVNDVVSAVLQFEGSNISGFDVFNISNRDSITVNEIAEIVFEVLGIDKEQVVINYTGGDRGWKADVPIVRLDPTKIELTGWRPIFGSRDAMKDAITKMHVELMDSAK